MIMLYLLSNRINMNIIVAFFSSFVTKNLNFVKLSLERLTIHYRPLGMYCSTRNGDGHGL
jgi:hypothetical protein